MPAHSEEFPWPSYYGHFKFFEDRMKQHSKIKSVEKVDGGLYNLTLSDSRTLKVFICECYSYGTAEYIETLKNIGQIDSVIISSNWCGYTRDLKIQCRTDKVGLFDIRDFMAALNQTNYWIYLNEHDAKTFKKLGIA